LADEPSAGEDFGEALWVSVEEGRVEDVCVADAVAEVEALLPGDE